MKEAILKRKSIRLFTGQGLTSKERSRIQAYLNADENLIGILGNGFKAEFIETNGSFKGKIGTYGMIENALAFVIVKSQNTKAAMLDLGFVFEKMVLFLVGMGLGTCWLGGSFDRAELSESIELEKGEFIPIVFPVGKTSEFLMEKEASTRTKLKSRKRKPLDEIFFEGNFETPIRSEAKRELLGYVGLAPSAKNLQPWRIVFGDDGAAHFYLERNQKLMEMGLPYDVQMIDMGIALSHYMSVFHKDEVLSTPPELKFPREIYEYVISVK